MPKLRAVLIAYACTLSSLGAGGVDALVIRGARIVTVSGPTLDAGTVVVRGGVIEAVGENPPIPAGARVVEGAGLTVYPGLIDALSNVGLPARLSAEGDKSAKSKPVYSHGPEDRPATTSWVRAANEFDPSDKRVEALRRAGFTAAVVFPMNGIVAGQGAVVELSGASDAVLDPSAGQYFALRPAEAGFPSTLFGALAYVKQLYLDLNYYRTQATGRFDRVLDGLAQSRRVLLPVDRRVEVDRLAELAQAVGQPAVFYGLQEGYRSADVLKESGARALVSLKWPTMPQDPDTTARQREVVEKAPSTPVVLRDEHVPFAFYTDGLAGRDELLTAVGKAINAGLAHDDAVRAFTLDAAAVYGLADRLGSVEVGKIANLVVTRGQHFDPVSRIEMLLIDGREVATPGATPSSGASKVVTSLRGLE